MTCHAFVEQVLGYFAAHDMHRSLHWTSEPLTFYVTCSDLLHWGSPDGALLAEGNWLAFKQAVGDCLAIDEGFGEIGGVMLFICREKKMRPQGAAYPENRDLWPLFDACGPEREVGLGNPYRPGEGAERGEEFNTPD